LVAQFIWVGHYYLVHYPKDSWRWWQVGYKDAFSELAVLAPHYNRVFINNTYEPSLIRFLFYTSYNPEKFHKQFTLDQNIPDIAPHYDGFTIDGKYYFGDFAQSAKGDIPRYFQPGSIYVISQRDNVGGGWDWRTSPPSGVEVLYTSVDPFNQPVLYLVTKKSS
jgi:hypothetical protein